MLKKLVFPRITLIKHSSITYSCELNMKKKPDKMLEQKTCFSFPLSFRNLRKQKKFLIAKYYSL